MKKISLLLISLFSLTLISCDEESVETFEEKTSFEVVNDFMNSLEIDNSQLIKDLVLPTTFSDVGLITWTTSNPDVMTNQGHVTRDEEENISVTLTATAVLENTLERRSYDVTVLSTPDSDQEKLDEVLQDFILIENNTVSRDVMVLPRVTDLHAGSITWQTADDSIIDLDGNVYRTNSDQEVLLSAEFSIGSAIETIEYQMRVLSTSEDRPDYIYTTDSRIEEKVYVSSNKEIIAATSDVEAGSAIIIQDGVYDDLVLNIEASGTKENPIFLFAENPGNVFITGESSISVEGDYVTIANLDFIDGNPNLETGVIDLDGENLRLTNCKIEDFEKSGNDYKWVSLTGKYHEVDHNIFDTKSTGGSLLTIWRNDGTDAQYHHIHHNQFLNFADNGGANGYETIRVGTSTYSQSDSHVLIENNYFEDCDGEIEIISIKSGRVIVQNNTFVSCMGHVTSRHGKNNVIQNNVFLTTGESGAGGIRAYDGGHVIKNNYIDSVNTTSNTRGGIVIHSGVNSVGETATVNLQWTAFNIKVCDNTIVDSTGNSILFCGKYTYEPTDITMQNNLIVSPLCGAVRYDSIPSNIEWTSNYMYAPSYMDEESQVDEDVAIDDGIIFSTSTIELDYNEDGLKLHNTIGAQISDITLQEETGCSR